MTRINDYKLCACRTCEYSRKIHALAECQANKDDRKEIEDLYEHFALLEDDVALYRGRWAEVRPVLHLLRQDHFLVKDRNIRLEGHQDCPMCALLETLG